MRIANAATEREVSTPPNVPRLPFYLHPLNAIRKRASFLAACNLLDFASLNMELDNL